MVAYGWFRNKSNGKKYFVIDFKVINKTNRDDGKEMVLYSAGEGELFVRNKKEFFEKFEEDKKLNEETYIIRK